MPSRLSKETSAVEAFYCFSHKDERFRKALDTHLALLKNEGAISTWNFGCITAGNEWDKDIKARIESASIVLLLVSADFMASQYIWEVELKRAMERHDAGTARVIPIMVRECDYKTAPFAKLQAFPRKNDVELKPVSKWKPQDGAYVNIAQAIRKALTELNGKAAVASVSSKIRLARSSSPDAQGILVDFRQFYGDDLRQRHGYKFKSVRAELAEKDGNRVLVKSEPLAPMRSWLKGSGRLLVVCGTGGLGKSRLLIETAKENGRVRFAPTRLWDRGYQALAEALAKLVRSDDIVVFDDVQEYAGDFGSLLRAVLGAGARVIAATRYFEMVETVLQQTHASPVRLELRRMANPAEVVPERDKENLASINRIAQGNPAIAVMAFMHYRRTGNLRGIYDAFGLMKSVFSEMVEAGEQAGFTDTSAFIAQMAVRSGLWQNHTPFPGHEALVAKLKPMGHIWIGGSVQRRAYGIAPDQLRDHIIRDLYAPADVFQQTAFEQMLRGLPDDDAVHVVRMLAIQYRETQKDVWKQACGTLLARYAGKSHGPGIGFGATLDHKPLELVIDIGYEAWEQFADVSMVRDRLGDFCAGADRLISIAHLNKAGLFYMHTGEPDKALVCYEKGATLARAEENKRGLASLLGNIGLIYFDKGQLGKAQENTEQVRRIMHEEGDKRGEASALGNLGNIYFSKGKLDKALKCYEDALAMARDIGDRQCMARDLGSIGSIFDEKGEPDRALRYLEAALATARDIGDWQGVATHLGNIGIIYKRKGEPDRALANFGEVLKISHQMGWKEGVATSLGNIGRTLVQKGEHEKATDALLTSLITFTTIGFADGPKQCLLGLVECEDKLGRKRMNELYRKAGLNEQSVANLNADVDLVRQAMGK